MAQEQERSDDRAGESGPVGHFCSSSATIRNMRGIRTLEANQLNAYLEESGANLAAQCADTHRRSAVRGRLV